MTVGLSIGISLAPEHGTSPEKLLKSADLALYRAKANGRDRVELADSPARWLQPAA